MGRSRGQGGGESLLPRDVLENAVMRASLKNWVAVYNSKRERILHIVGASEVRVHGTRKNRVAGPFISGCPNALMSDFYLGMGLGTTLRTVLRAAGGTRCRERR